MVKNRVRELRQKKKVTQLQMAIDLNVTRQTLIAIEKQKYNPSLELALKIARYFNTRVEDIFFLEEGGKE